MALASLCGRRFKRGLLPRNNACAPREQQMHNTNTDSPEKRSAAHPRDFWVKREEGHCTISIDYAWLIVERAFSFFLFPGPPGLRKGDLWSLQQSLKHFTAAQTNSDHLLWLWGSVPNFENWWTLCEWKYPGENNNFSILPQNLN